MKQFLITYLLFTILIYGSNNSKLAQTGFQFLSVSSDARAGGLKNSDAEPFDKVVIASAIPTLLASDVTLRNCNPVCPNFLFSVPKIIENATNI